MHSKAVRHTQTRAHARHDYDTQASLCYSTYTHTHTQTRAHAGGTLSPCGTGTFCLGGVSKSSTTVLMSGPRRPGGRASHAGRMQDTTTTHRRVCVTAHIDTDTHTHPHTHTQPCMQLQGTHYVLLLPSTSLDAKSISAFLPACSALLSLISLALLARDTGV